MMKYPALRFRPLSIELMVALKIPHKSSPIMPAGSVAVAMTKYDASCGLASFGKTACRSGWVIRATMGGINQTAGPRTNRIVPSRAAFLAFCVSFTLR